jgi:hypothetical protein
MTARLRRDVVLRQPEFLRMMRTWQKHDQQQRQEHPRLHLCRQAPLRR